jgi:fumarate reductase subunit C
MNNQPIYTDYHPRWLRQRVSTYWWLGKWPYVKFILRELSSIFVAWFVIYLLLLVRAVSQDQLAYSRFLVFSARPVVLTINVIAFCLSCSTRSLGSPWLRKPSWFTSGKTRAAEIDRRVTLRRVGDRLGLFWFLLR